MSEWGDISLDSIPFLAVASPRALARLHERTRVVDHKPGEVLFNEGDPPSHLLVIRRGRVEIVNVLMDGSEEVLRVLGRGELLGELGILGGHSRSASARALEDTRIWAIEREAFLDVYETEPAVAMEMAQVMARYLLDAESVAEDLLFLDLRGRLVKRLLFLADVVDSHVRRLVGVGEMSKDEVAALLQQAGRSGRLPPETFGQLDRLAMLAGGTRRSVAELLSGMQREGLLVIAEGSIILVDEEGLKEASRPT